MNEINIFFQLLTSHFFFDYGKMIFPSMLRAKTKGWPPGPIALHALFHTFGVFIVLFINNISIEKILLSCLVQFLTHFCIDSLKGFIETKKPNLKNNKSPWHWHLFQVDQYLHVSVMFWIMKIIS